MNKLHSQTKARRGIALIAVLWVVGFMTTLMVVTLTMIKFDVEENIADTQIFNAWQQAHTGLSYGLHPKIKRDDPILNSSNNEYDEGYEVTIEPEAKLLNINYALSSADKGTLINLFKDWGMEDDEVDQLIDAMADWIDEDDLISLNGAEKEYYEDIGYTDRPYNRIFQNLNEMRLVRGFYLIEQLKPNWSDYFTVWSKGPLDINEADSELIAAAAGTELSIADEFKNLIVGEDGKMGTEDDIRFESVNDALNDLASPAENRETVAQRFTTNGNILRIESIGRSGNYKYMIKVISSAKGQQTEILDYQEKQLVSE